jgi:hypothetical protein
MKVCLNSRCEKKYLQQADEIKVEYRDRKALLDIVDDYPDKTIILQVPYFFDPEENDLDWQQLSIANKLLQGKLIICCFSEVIANMAKLNDIKFYFGYPIQSAYQLQAVKAMGACYVRLGETLFFNIKKTAAVGVPIRVIPNIAYIDGLPREDGVCGTWIRPEDIHLYEDYVAAMEFEDCKPTKEQALFRIYTQQKEWPGDLGLLITNFNHLGLNRLILPEVGEKRLDCRHICQLGGHCRICYRAMDLANKEDLTDYAEAMNLI